MVQHAGAAIAGEGRSRVEGYDQPGRP